MLCAKIGWNWPTGSGEEDRKLWKVYNDDNDKGQKGRKWYKKW